MWSLRAAAWESLLPLVGSADCLNAYKNMGKGSLQGIRNHAGWGGGEWAVVTVWEREPHFTCAVRTVHPESQDWGGAFWLWSLLKILYAGGKRVTTKLSHFRREDQAYKLGTRAGGRAGAQRVRPEARERRACLRPGLSRTTSASTLSSRFSTE